MADRLIAPMGGALLMALLAAGSAQGAAAPAPLAIPEPRYSVMVLEQTVERPAPAVWAKVGDYCAIAQWLRVTCQVTSGPKNDLGAVRALNNGAVVEMLVAKTDLSYTYTQPVRMGVPFNAYHGTLEAKPLTATTSKLVYSFFYDTSMLADDAARATEATGRRARFMDALQNMKIMAEGGTVPPAPAPAR